MAKILIQDSSTVWFVEYSESLHTMTLTFDSKRKYVYFDVPLVTYEQFLNSPSKGGFVQDILTKEFRYREVK